MSTRQLTSRTARVPAGRLLAVPAVVALTASAAVLAGPPAASAASVAAGVARGDAVATGRHATGRHATGAVTSSTSLVLTVTRTGAKAPRTVTLRCDPPRGSHPHPAQACAAVTAANGRLTALKPTPGVMCTMEYAPATATAAGTWHGRAVTYRHTFSNGCLMGVETGSVFQF